jgi:hypothetical protein
VIFPFFPDGLGPTVNFGGVRIDPFIAN